MKLVAIDGRCPHCGTDSSDPSAIGLTKNMTIADKDTAIQSLRDQLAAAQAREAELNADNARLREALEKIEMCGNRVSHEIATIALAKVRKP